MKITPDERSIPLRDDNDIQHFRRISVILPFVLTMDKRFSEIMEIYENASPSTSNPTGRVVLPERYSVIAAPSDLKMPPAPKTPPEDLSFSSSMASLPRPDSILTKTLPNRLPSTNIVSASQTILQIPSSSLSSFETCHVDSEHSPTTMHPVEDALKFFLPKDLRVEALSSSALKAFAIIEPWLAAQKWCLPL
jgi:hypothetical protein